MRSYQFIATIAQIDIARILQEQPADVRAVVVTLPAGPVAFVRGSTYNAAVRAELRDENGRFPLCEYSPACEPGRYSVDEKGSLVTKDWSSRRYAGLVPDECWIAHSGDKIGAARETLQRLSDMAQQLHTVTVEQI